MELQATKQIELLQSLEQIEQRKKEKVSWNKKTCFENEKTLLNWISNKKT